MKKVLLLIPYNSSFYPPIKKTFRELGYQVRTYDYRKGELAIRVVRFTPLIGKKIASDLIKKRIKALSDKFKPEIVLTVKGETLSKGLIESIKKPNNKVVNWFPDPLNTWDLMVEIAPYYDYFLHFDPLIVKKLRTIGYKNTFYLPFAAEITKDQSHSGKIYDISFVGTYSKDREKKLSYLTNFDLNIWGDPRWFTSSLRQFTKGGRISQNAMKKIIEKSKININIHHNLSKKGANLRTFEVTGACGFLLSDYMEDIMNLYAINKELVCYRTAEELQSKAKYFLTHDLLRKKIAARGYKKAKEKHNYKNRMEQLVNLINK